MSVEPLHSSFNVHVNFLSSLFFHVSLTCARLCYLDTVNSRGLHYLRENVGKLSTSKKQNVSQSLLVCRVNLPMTTYRVSPVVWG